MATSSPTDRPKLRMVTAIAVVTLAVTSSVAYGGEGGDAAPDAVSQTPVREQLAWVVSEVNGDSATLAQPEVKAHFAAGFLAAVPAAQVVSLIKQATTDDAPIRIVRFAGHPSATSAMALIETRQKQKLAIYVSVDRSAEHRITGLEVGERPGIGAAGVAVPGRHTGAFDIGGRKLYLNCSGSGTPTVILEAGANGGSHSWAAVQPRLATANRVCSYDRANLPGGSSDPAPKPRTAAHIVADLHKLLAAARVPGPFVLAGHSNGGLFARLYATTYPQQVKGLALIDTGNYPAMLKRVHRRLLSPQEWRAYAATQNAAAVRRERLRRAGRPGGELRAVGTGAAPPPAPDDAACRHQPRHPRPGDGQRVGSRPEHGDRNRMAATADQARHPRPRWPPDRGRRRAGT